MIYIIKKIPFKLKLSRSSSEKPLKTGSNLLEVVKAISLEFNVKEFKFKIGETLFKGGYEPEESHYWEALDEDPKEETFEIAIISENQQYKILRLPQILIS